MEFKVKKWFLMQKFTQGERYAISVADDCFSLRETEKAVLLKWITKFGNIESWIPKSCLEA